MHIITDTFLTLYQHYGQSEEVLLTLVDIWLFHVAGSERNKQTVWFHLFSRILPRIPYAAQLMLYTKAAKDAPRAQLEPIVNRTLVIPPAFAASDLPALQQLLQALIQLGVGLPRISTFLNLFVSQASGSEDVLSGLLDMVQLLGCQLQPNLVDTLLKSSNVKHKVVAVMRPNSSTLYSLALRDSSFTLVNSALRPVLSRLDVNELVSLCAVRYVTAHAPAVRVLSYLAFASLLQRRQHNYEQVSDSIGIALVFNFEPDHIRSLVHGMGMPSLANVPEAVVIKTLPKVRPYLDALSVISKLGRRYDSLVLLFQRFRSLAFSALPLLVSLFFAPSVGPTSGAANTTGGASHTSTPAPETAKDALAELLASNMAADPFLVRTWVTVLGHERLPKSHVVLQHESRLMGMLLYYSRQPQTAIATYHLLSKCLQEGRVPVVRCCRYIYAAVENVARFLHSTHYGLVEASLQFLTGLYKYLLESSKLDAPSLMETSIAVRDQCLKSIVILARLIDIGVSADVFTLNTKRAPTEKDAVESLMESMVQSITANAAVANAASSGAKRPSSSTIHSVTSSSAAGGNTFSNSVVKERVNNKNDVAMALRAAIQCLSVPHRFLTCTPHAVSLVTLFRYFRKRETNPRRIGVAEWISWMDPSPMDRIDANELDNVAFVRL
jgi:hypothetical protein